MSWVKQGDEAVMHPVVLAALELEDADDRTTNELFGCMGRCSSLVAAHKGDYVIRRGMFITVAGATRWRVLWDQAIRAGYAVAVELEDGSPALKIVEDEGLFHMIPRAERERNNARRNDTRDDRLIVPVRVRDGDQCRWCGVVVQWGNKRGGRGGTYDHVHPGQPAKSPDDLLVCCRTCNSARQDDLASWTRQLLPPPTDPYYSDSSVNFLAKRGATVRSSEGRTPVRETTSGQTNGTQTAAHSGRTPATADETTEQRPARVPEPGPSQDAPNTRAPRSGESRQIEAVTDLDMPGRDGHGSGRGGKGPQPPTPPTLRENPSPPDPSPAGTKSRRRRRRKRR